MQETLWRRLMHGSLAVVVLAGSVSLTGAQSSSPPRPMPSGAGGGTDAPNQAGPYFTGFPGDGDIPMDAGMRFRREEARKLQRHKSMVDNATRLVEATRQFNSDIQGRQTTAADEKKLEEIARLAHQLKQQMLGD